MAIATHEFRIKVPTWKTIFWMDHPEARQYEHQIEWLREQAIEQHSLNEDDWETGLTNYQLIEGNDDELVIELALERI